MTVVIPSNTATAALRRIPFTLVDATDLYTPEDVTVTGVKVSLNLSGGTPANSTNDIVKVAGSTGEYYIELTQAEANQTAGTYVRGTLTPTGCALAKLEAQIGPSDVFTVIVATSAQASSTLSATTSSATQQSTAESTTLSTLALRPTSTALSTVESTSLSAITIRATSAQASTTGSTTASVAASAALLVPSGVLSAAVSASGLYAHVRQINGAAVSGNGTSGNKWRG